MISVYEAGQFYEPQDLAYFKDDKCPEIAEFNNRSQRQKIYLCGYTIIAYILHDYGKDELIQLIDSYGDLNKVFNLTEEQFSIKWHLFMTEKYPK